jgi:hypothetical protein
MCYPFVVYDTGCLRLHCAGSPEVPGGINDGSIDRMDATARACVGAG